MRNIAETLDDNVSLAIIEINEKTESEMKVIIREKLKRKITNNCTVVIKFE